MDYSLFERLIEKDKDRRDKYDTLESFSIGVYEIDEFYDEVFDLLLKTHWSQEGVEWIYWFIDDAEYGEKVWTKKETVIKLKEDDTYEEIENPFDDGYGAHDKNGNPICYDTKSLYEYLKQYEKPTYKVLKNPVHK